MPGRSAPALSVLAILAAVPAPVAAQSGGVQLGVPTTSRAVVQPLPAPNSLGLNEALGRLARDPRDVSALIDAGTAALAMGDVEAAIGFFNRADQVSPRNPQVKAGLAGALVRNENPFDAIPLFEEAEKAGAVDSALAADRGLAYDLVGDNLTAQGYYRLALSRAPNDEVSRRLALSHAMAGDRRSAETTLAPLLQKQDKAAWRTRAFVLAILGQPEEAVAIANQTLPRDLAGAIAPYLRYMPRLTPAQQAAAANFGHFPRASEIGRDDPRVLRFAPKTRPKLASAEPAAPPRSEVASRSRSARYVRNAARPATARQPAASPAASTPARSAPPVPPVPTRAASEPAAPSAAQRSLASTATTGELPPVAAAAAAPAPAPAPAPVPAVSLAQAPTAAASASAPTGTVTASPLLPPAPATPTTAVVAPRPVALPAPPPPRRSLAEAFADLSRPTIDTAPAAGAVDLRRITPARPKPKEEAKPPLPSHPSRIWVQVATGRDKKALAFDWKRMTQKAESTLRGKSPSVSAWGQTNRLLTGPFPSEAAANSFIGQLRKAEIVGAFVWNSPAGQVVDALPTGK